MGRRQTIDFNNKEFWTKGNQIEDEQLIHEYEEKIGHQFPDSFIQFTKEFHNGTSKKHEHVVNEKMNLYLQCMLSFNKDDEPFSIWEELYFGMTEFDPYVIIALDIGDNLIALDYSKSETEPSVVFVDHELLGMIFLEEDRDYSDEEIEAMETSVRLKDFPWAIFHVADRFLEFLNGLDGEDPPEEGEWFPIEHISESNLLNLVSLEKKLNKKLPALYKKLVKKYQGNFIDNNTFEGFSDELLFTRFFNLDTTSPLYLINKIEIRGFDYWKDIVLFAIGNGIDLIAFDYNENPQNPSIIYIKNDDYWNCEDSIMNQYDKYTKLADNFEEFCNKMKYPPIVD